MFANQSISNNIGIVYLKSNICSLTFSSKIRKNGRKQQKKRQLGSRSDTEHRLRSPTPTPNPRPINWVIRAAPNNSSLIQPDLCEKAARNWCVWAENRTIVHFPIPEDVQQVLQQEDWVPGSRPNNSSAPSPVAAAEARNKLGHRANNRRNLRLFWPAARNLPGSESEQSFAFTPSWWEKRTIIRLTPGRKQGQKTNKKNQS